MRRKIRIAWTIFSVLLIVLTCGYVCAVTIIDILVPDDPPIEVLMIPVVFVFLAVTVPVEIIFCKCIYYFLQDEKNKSKGKTKFYIVLFVLDLAAILFEVLCVLSVLGILPRLTHLLR